jgi:hypothetical protein
MTARQFLQSAVDTRNAVRELLQIVFASELLAPSRCLWLVSPWLREVGCGARSESEDSAIAGATA